MHEPVIAPQHPVVRAALEQRAIQMAVGLLDELFATAQARGISRDDFSRIVKQAIEDAADDGRVAGRIEDAITKRS